MGGDFEFYERDYLERLAKNKSAPVESYEQTTARLHRELVESAKKVARETELGAWDYAALEMVRRGDPGAPMRLGTLRFYESLLRLHCHGLVARLDRRPTFDETERIQAFLDSPAFKQYQDRLERIMTKDVAERLALVAQILGFRDVTDLMDLTRKGGEVLNSKRAEVAALYERIVKQYSKNRVTFYGDAPSYESILPMLLAMGFAGPAIAYVLASSDARYGALGGFDAVGTGTSSDGFGFDME